LIGLFPILLILITQIKRNLKLFDEQYRYYYLLSVSADIALGFFKAMGGGYMYLTAFILSPGFYYFNNTRQEHVREIP